MPTLTSLHCAMMIDMLARVSLVLTLGLLLALTARKDAALRHAILVAGLVAALVVPAAMLTMSVLPVSRMQVDLRDRVELNELTGLELVRSQPPNTPHHGRASLDQPGTAISRTKVARSEELSRMPTADGRVMLTVVFSALLFGAVVKVIGLGCSLLRLNRMVARARPVASDQILSLIGLIQRRIPLRQPPCLLESVEIPAPVAAGVIGDCVLLPAGWAENLSQDEMLAVLCHESAHLARRDHYVVILQELLASVLWFHPLVHLFNRVLNRAREEVCDNFAITMVERFAYCETLLHLAVGHLGKATPGATSIWTHDWSLEDRIRGILDDQRLTRTSISGFGRSATVIFAIMICGLVAMPQLIASQNGDRNAARAKAKVDANFSQPAKPGPVAKSPMTRGIIKTFPVSGKSTLRFENLAGRVEIVPGNGPAVEVEAIVRVSDLAEADVNRLIDHIDWVQVRGKDSKLRWGLAFPADRFPTVRYPVPGETPPGITTLSYLGRELRISDRPGESIPAVEFDLRISLPPKVPCAVYNAVGPIEGRAIISPLEVATRQGAIKLDDVRSPIMATSEFGDVLISRLNADAIIRTGSGGIELSRALHGRVNLSARSGNCRILQPPGASFKLQYSGNRPIAVMGSNIKQISAQNNGQRRELLSQGTGGPSITVTGGSGETVVETGP